LATQLSKSNRGGTLTNDQNSHISVDAGDFVV